MHVALGIFYFFNNKKLIKKINYFGCLVQTWPDDAASAFSPHHQLEEEEQLLLAVSSLASPLQWQIDPVVDQEIF